MSTLLRAGLGSSVVAALGFLAGMGAVALIGAQTAPSPTIARIRPFVAPLAEAAVVGAADAVATPNREDTHERR
jgi:hypothetical protein